MKLFPVVFSFPSDTHFLSLSESILIQFPLDSLSLLCRPQPSIHIELDLEHTSEWKKLCCRESEEMEQRRMETIESSNPFQNIIQHPFPCVSQLAESLSQQFSCSLHLVKFTKHFSN